MAIKNLKINISAFALAAVTFVTSTLTGCDYSSEVVPEESYDIVSISYDSGLMTKGLVQELDVSGEEFKLVTEYTCDSESKRLWRVTSDKYLYLQVYTKDLPDDTKVYIDNIHIDTSIKSNYPSVDGILQDTMDDRVHNAQMIGFPIGNDIYYYGIDAIEGANQDFIQGTFYGYSGCEIGQIEEERYTEADYLELGVYANKFQIVYDLLIQGPNDEIPRNVSVCTDFLVPISENAVSYVKTKTLED